MFFKNIWITTQRKVKATLERSIPLNNEYRKYNNKIEDFVCAKVIEAFLMSHIDVLLKFEAIKTGIILSIKERK